ncbi:hypothetical protein [Streptomyces sp. NBC_01264]|uniref:hypothetical protein n=1 Tax=Streptomyces sp. NBC_01264 TaxID=2903804 RepID=UPI0022519FC7|nr:hypothetical protein [Streptomyces sp. NBC_01264]MCX4784318.1 hypothetical protein [Streptomyces sp. NBC_01264]
MLKVSEDPQVEPGGVYFLYNPDTQSRAGSFIFGGDVARPTVRNWRSAVFAPDLSVPRTEVRYGSTQDPSAARVVASVTNGWIGELSVGIQTFTGSAGNPQAALAEARRLMSAAVKQGRFNECTELAATSSWVKLPGRPANGTATVTASCN